MKEKTSVQIHPSIIKLINSIEALKEEVSLLFSKRETLLNTVGPNLEAMYNVKIGKKEYALFCLQCNIKRLKRKIELFQASINKGQTISNKEVEKKLNEEFKEWQEKIENIYNDIKNSEIRLNSLMTYEDSMEIKRLYKLLVKKLHPDINPNQSEKEKALWLRVNQAYKQNDLEELKTLEILVNDKNEKVKEIKINSNIDELNTMIEKMNKKIITLTKNIENMKSQFPFKYEKLLQNDKWIHTQNKNIQNNIDALNNHKKYLETMLNMMSTPNNGMLN